MLRPLILLFLNFYYVDLLVFNVLIGSGTFLYVFFVDEVPWWHFLIQLPIAIGLALFGRWPQRRLDGTAGRPALLFLNRRGDDWTRPLLVVLVLSVCTLGYNQRIHHPASPVSHLFPIGIARSLVIIELVSFFVECIGYYLAQPSCTFKLLGVHSMARLLLLLLHAVDMVAFANAYASVLTALGMFIALFAVGQLFKWLFRLRNKHY